MIYNGEVLVQLADPTGYYNYMTVGLNLQDNQWHFVAVSIDRQSVTGLKFFIDGLLSQTRNPTNR